MKKYLIRIISVLLILMLLVAIPLMAEEQLMTKIFFDNYLIKTTTPLENQINNLQATLAALNESLRQLQRQLTTEVRVTIGHKTAYVDDQAKNLDVAPVIRSDRTMVPMRFIGEALGAQVDWEDASRKVTYSIDDIKIELFIGKKTARLNGKNITLDVDPVIVSERTMVPLRFVGEYMGATVDWDDNTRTAIILR